jgi:site-specific DNA-methyltransferase (adenine-specific)
MRPFYQHSGITIFHGDCLTILPELERSSVDVLLTDPPYGISYKSNRREVHGGLPVSIRGDRNLNALRDALPLIDTLLKPDRHCYVFASPMRVGEVVEAVGEYFTPKNILVWDKGNAGSMGDCRAGYSANWEAIVYANKGRRALAGPRPRCIYRYDWQARRDPVHPTVKPIGVMRWLLAKSSRPGEVVLDPFMGSGGVLAAAAALGRQAIGIEMEERYCRAAVDRLTRL